MTRLSFGLLPAQCASLYCLDNAIENNAMNASPVAVLTALRNFYVDDGLFSFASEAELIAFFKEIVPLLVSRTFRLPNFSPPSKFQEVSAYQFFHSPLCVK